MIGKSAWNALNFTGHDIYSSDQNLCLCMNKLVYYNLVTKKKKVELCINNDR